MKNVQVAKKINISEKLERLISHAIADIAAGLWVKKQTSK